MADGFKIEVKGVKELQSKFKLLDKDIRDIISKGVSQGAAVVEREAKIIVPVRTGRLRNSITEMQTTVSSTKVESQVGTDVEYGLVVEFRKPYLRPALDNNENEIKDAISKAIISRLGGR